MAEPEQREPWLPPGEMPLVHEAQAFRLCLRQCLPLELHPGHWFPVSVGCRNEFGLWKRDMDFEPVALQLTLLSLAGQDLDLCIETEGCLEMDSSGKLDFAARVLSDHVETGAILLRISAVSATHPLLPVLSPPLILGCRSGEDPLPRPGTLTLEQCRLIRVPGTSSSLLLAECAGDLGIGGRVWDGGLVLLEYLASLPGLGHCLELGSGTGLVGLGCALLGAQVCLTDLKEVTPLLELNVALNRCRGLQLNAKVETLEWGTDLSDFEWLSADLVIMADVVYDVEASRQLMMTLTALAASESSSRFIMAFRPRNVEKDFFRELSKEFQLTVLEGSGPYAKMCHDLQILQLTAAPKSETNIQYHSIRGSKGSRDQFCGILIRLMHIHLFGLPCVLISVHC